jgi:biopolymer transport protein ExbD
MQFTTRKHRQPPAVIIISLIDILIVLLIFMMITTTFKQTPALKITLPQSSAVPKPGSSQNPMMIVTIAKAEPHLYLNQTPVTLTKLQEEFTAAMARNTGATVALKPDQDAPLQEFLSVMEAASSAKIKTVPVYTRPKGK